MVTEHNDRGTGTEGEDSGRNPFRSRDFTRWWLASLVAGTGVGIQAVTVPIFIRDRVDLEVRALAISAALIAQTAPAAAVALVGGTIADRVERRQILVRTFAVAALVSLAYVFLSAMEVESIWPVFPLAAAVGCAGAFTNPARQSMLPQLVGRSQLQNGVIFGTMGYMAALQFLGPTVGGLLTDYRGLTVAFGAEVGLLILAAAFFAGIRTDQPTLTGRDVLGDLVDGLRYVRSEPTISSLLLLGAIPGVFFIGPFAVTVPLVVPDIFQATDKWVGILWGCFGSGVFLGSILLTIRPFPRRGYAICASNLAGGLVLVAYGSSRSLPLSATLLVAWGMGASVFINYVVALIQENTEARMMGRVMSMYSLVFFASMPIGYGQAGLLTSRFDASTTLVANGVAAAAIGLLSLLFLRPVHRLR